MSMGNGLVSKAASCRTNGGGRRSCLRTQRPKLARRCQLQGVHACTASGPNTPCRRPLDTATCSHDEEAPQQRTSQTRPRPCAMTLCISARGRCPCMHCVRPKQLLMALWRAECAGQACSMRGIRRAGAKGQGYQAVYCEEHCGCVSHSRHSGELSL